MGHTAPFRFQSVSGVSRCVPCYCGAMFGGTMTILSAEQVLESNSSSKVSFRRFIPSVLEHSPKRRSRKLEKSKQTKGEWVSIQPPKINGGRAERRGRHSGLETNPFEGLCRRGLLRCGGLLWFQGSLAVGGVGRGWGGGFLYMAPPVKLLCDVFLEAAGLLQNQIYQKAECPFSHGLGGCELYWGTT